MFLPWSLSEPINKAKEIINSNLTRSNNVANDGINVCIDILENRLVLPNLRFDLRRPDVSNAFIIRNIAGPASLFAQADAVYAAMCDAI